MRRQNARLWHSPPQVGELDHLIDAAEFDVLVAEVELIRPRPAQSTAG